VKIDSFIKSDAKHFLIQANKLNYTSKKDWSSKCYEWKQKWHSLSDHDISDTNGISMYYFIDQLSENNKNDSAVVSDAGSAYYIASQALKTTKEQRYITSGAQADMGFTIPACIGVSNANKQIDVIGITGDGSFQTNIQELQTIKHHSYPIKIFVLNNHGYLSIRTTQRKFFNDRFVGTCKNSGVSFPKTEDICKAYGIKYFCFKTNQELQNGIKKVLNEKQPVVCEVICKEWDQVLPTISSKKTKEGKMVSKPLEDMFPFLTREEFNDNMVIEPLLEE
jgi:acetolactate synthase-1/2/3 large subunit